MKSIQFQCLHLVLYTFHWLFGGYATVLKTLFLKLVSGDKQVYYEKNIKTLEVIRVVCYNRKMTVIVDKKRKSRTVNLII